jgi:hypothetical protein
MELKCGNNNQEFVFQYRLVGFHLWSFVLADVSLTSFRFVPLLDSYQCGMDLWWFVDYQLNEKWSEMWKVAVFRETWWWIVYNNDFAIWNAFWEYIEW